MTTCSASGCHGSVTTTQQTVGLSSTSTSGTILTTVDPADQSSFSCGDSFRHAPQVTTVTDTGLNANIVYTITFKNTAAAGQWFVPFAVCYQAQTAFKDLYGHSVTTGLLPICTGSATGGSLAPVIEHSPTAASSNRCRHPCGAGDAKHIAVSSRSPSHCTATTISVIRSCSSWFPSRFVPTASPKS